MSDSELDLVGVAEISEMAGVSRKRAYELIQKPDFPKPAVDRSTGRLWHRQHVKQWLVEWEERKRTRGGRYPRSSRTS